MSNFWGAYQVCVLTIVSTRTFLEDYSKKIDLSSTQ